MQDALLWYYQRELAWLHQAGNDFAASHPGVGVTLQPRSDVVDDPQVARLLDGVAFLNARMHQTLDDGLPRVTDALLAQLFPSCALPLPSMGIVEVDASTGNDDSTLIAAGSLLVTTTGAGTPCRFRTVYPLALAPITLASAQLLALSPVSGLPSPGRGACAVLALRIECRNASADLSRLLPAALPLHIRAPAPFAWRLYDLLFNHCRAIGITSGEHNAVQWLDADDLAPMGLDDGQAMLPITPAALPALGLVTEFLHFPAKFLFFSVRNLASRCTPGSDACTLLFYFDRLDHELASQVSAQCLSLSATPVVNLFPYAAEPLQVQGDAIDLPLLAEVRDPDGFEIHSITRVELIDAGNGTRCDLPELHALPHAASADTLYWHHRRALRPRPATHAGAGYDSFISCCDLRRDARPLAGVLHVTALCSNRNLPARLPAGASQPQFMLLEDPGRCSRIRSLVPPTSSLRPETGAAATWRLLALATLNQQYLFGADDPAALLQELLTVHEMADSTATRALIRALEKVTITPAVAPLRRHGVSSLCRGLDIELTLRHGAGTHVSLLLYGAVLERLLAQMISINSFVRVTLRHGDDGTVIRRSPPRGGTGALL